MRFIAILLAFAAVSGEAFAQQAPPPDLVLLPRDVAQAARDWVASPNASNAVQLYAALNACIADNPQPGMQVLHNGPDACQVVTDAIAARNKEITDLRAQLEATKKPPVETKQ